MHEFEIQIISVYLVNLRVSVTCIYSVWVSTHVIYF